MKRGEREKVGFVAFSFWKAFAFFYSAGGSKNESFQPLFFFFFGSQLHYEEPTSLVSYFSNLDQRFFF